MDLSKPEGLFMALILRYYDYRDYPFYLIVKRQPDEGGAELAERTTLIRHELSLALPELKVERTELHKASNRRELTLALETEFHEYHHFDKRRQQVRVQRWETHTPLATTVNERLPIIERLVGAVSEYDERVDALDLVNWYWAR